MRNLFSIFDELKSMAVKVGRVGTLRGGHCRKEAVWDLGTGCEQYLCIF